MKERPILFSGEMVRAILDGRKTQTRRLVRTPPRGAFVLLDTERNGQWWPYASDNGTSALCNDGNEHPMACPYGAPGDRLWVKETFQLLSLADGGDSYEANAPARVTPDGHRVQVCHRADGDSIGAPWKPSIFMPRWASRITLQVEAVRVERLQSAKLADLRAEGMSREDHEKCLASFTGAEYQREWWRTLWDSINGERAPYASNPWVWVVEFHRVQEVARAA